MPCSNLVIEPAHEILVIIAMVSSEHSDKPAQINHVIVAFASLSLGYICLTTSIRCPYDVQITVSVRHSQGDLAIIVRIYGHRGLYDFV